MASFGRWSSAQKVSEGVDLTGKTAFVTGANAGLGEETSRVLALRGAHVVMACRDQKRAAQARERILDRHPHIPGERLELVELDLGSLKSVRKCAEAYLASDKPLHLLINNAGVMLPLRRETSDGLESHFGINHVGHFLLTTLLQPRLEASAPARVVMLASDALKMAGLTKSFDDLNWRTRSYKNWPSYGDSKLMNVMFACELNERLSGTGVVANAVHPGMIPTGLAKEHGAAMMAVGVVLLPFMKTIPMGASTTMLAATAPEYETKGGVYLSNCQPQRTPRLAADADARRGLWERTEAQIREVEAGYSSSGASAA